MSKVTFELERSTAKRILARLDELWEESHAMLPSVQALREELRAKLAVRARRTTPPRSR